jgi:hypothetical protein
LVLNDKGLAMAGSALAGMDVLALVFVGSGEAGTWALAAAILGATFVLAHGWRFLSVPPPLLYISS